MSQRTVDTSATLFPFNFHEHSGIENTAALTIIYFQFLNPPVQKSTEVRII
jgi:hypothetical protein